MASTALRTRFISTSRSSAPRAQTAGTARRAWGARGGARRGPALAPAPRGALAPPDGLDAVAHGLLDRRQALGEALGRGLAGDELGVAQDRLEQVVEVVGHAHRELAERRELLRARHVLFPAALLGDVLGHEEEACLAAPAPRDRRAGHGEGEGGAAA